MPTLVWCRTLSLKRYKTEGTHFRSCTRFLYTGNRGEVENDCVDHTHRTAWCIVLTGPGPRRGSSVPTDCGSRFAAHVRPQEHECGKVRGSSVMRAAMICWRDCVWLFPGRTRDLVCRRPAAMVSEAFGSTTESEGVRVTAVFCCLGEAGARCLDGGVSDVVV